MAWNLLWEIPWLHYVVKLLCDLWILDVFKEKDYIWINTNTESSEEHMSRHVGRNTHLHFFKIVSPIPVSALEMLEMKMGIDFQLQEVFK